MGGQQRQDADAAERMGGAFFTLFGAAIGVTKNEGKINYDKALDTRRTILNTQQPTKKTWASQRRDASGCVTRGGRGGVQINQF